MAINDGAFTLATPRTNNTIKYKHIDAPKQKSSLISQIKNTLSTFFGRDIETKQGSGRYEKRKGYILLIDDDWAREEAIEDGRY